MRATISVLRTSKNKVKNERERYVLINITDANNNQPHSLE